MQLHLRTEMTSQLKGGRHPLSLEVIQQLSIMLPSVGDTFYMIQLADLLKWHHGSLHRGSPGRKGSSQKGEPMHQQQCGKRNVQLELSPNSCLFTQAAGWLPVSETLIRLCLMQPRLSSCVPSLDPYQPYKPPR